MTPLGSRTVTGLDIGAASAKAVQLALAETGWRVTRVEREVYSEISFTTDPAGRARLVRHLRALMDRVGDPGYLVTALPRHKVVLKTISLPSVEAGELPRMVAFEAGRHLSIPLEEVRLDYELIGVAGLEGADALPQGAARNRSDEVILAAVKWSDLDRHVTLVRDAGLDPDHVDVSSLALAAAFLGMRGLGVRAPGGPVAIVDVGAQAVDLIVVGHGGMPVSRRSLVAGEEIPRIVDDIRQTLRGGAKADRLFLCGGRAAEPGLLEAFGQGVQIPTAPFDPFGDLSAAPPLPEARGAYALAVGLALRGAAAQAAGVLNLLPPELMARKRRRLVRRRRGLAAAGIAAALLAGWLVAAREWFTSTRALRQLDAKARSAGPVMREVRWVVDRLESVRTFTDRRTEPLDVLREACVRAPSGIYLTAWVYDRGRPLLLRGRAVSYAAVSQFLVELGRSPWLKSVSSRGLREQSSEGQTWVEFEINASLVPQ